MIRNIFLVLLVSGMLFAAPNVGPVLPPDNASVEAANKLVLEIYGNDIKAAKQPSDKCILANKFLQVAANEKDVAAKYALYNNARNFAIESSVLQLSLKAIDEMAGSFMIDATAMKVDAAIAVSKGLKIPSSKKLFVQQADQLVLLLIFLDRYDSARQVVELELASARTCEDPVSLRLATARSKQVKETEIAYNDAQRAMKALGNNPNDADANLKVGKYGCFIKGDWDALGMLAAGSDPVLKALAKADINATSIEEKIKVADGWWDYAQREKGIGRDQILARAAKWYREITPKLQGLAKAKAEKRLAEIAAEPDDKATVAKKPDSGKSVSTLFKDEKQIKDSWKMPEKWSISSREGVVPLQQQAIESKFTINGDCIIQIACTGRPRVELFGERLSSAIPPNNANGQDNLVVRPDQGMLIVRKGNRIIVKNSASKFDSAFDIKESERAKPSKIKISGNWYVTILSVEVRAESLQMDQE